MDIAVIIIIIGGQGISCTHHRDVLLSIVLLLAVAQDASRLRASGSPEIPANSEFLVARHRLRQHHFWQLQHTDIYRILHTCLHFLTRLALRPSDSVLRWSGLLIESSFHCLPCPFRHVALGLNNRPIIKMAKADTKTKSSTATQKRTTKSKKDPAAPKRPLSAYMFFSQDHRERVKAANPDAGFGDIGRLLGARWKEMSDAEKKPYLDMANRDKARAEAEKAAYNKRR